MGTNGSPRRTGLRLLYRGVALFFLAFTVFDLCSPDVCAEEILGFPQGAFAQAAAADTGSAAVTSSTPSTTNPIQEQSYPEEDCFCCCSHLVATPHFFLVEACDLVPLPRPDVPLALTVPLRTPFHPPRFV